MLSDRLRYLREKNGYTQRQVAEYLNIERSTYTYYEIGKTKPDLEALKKLSAFFHVSIDYLLENKTVLRGEYAPYDLDRSREDGMTGLPDEEKLLLRLYRKLNTEAKKSLLENMARIIKNQST
ncbi:helix-turn-helix transcriptional regulator [[Clostridium] leptum]|nr:helix-turn-helix transcriptional regulator [[Clostridium] leptum]